MPNDKIHHSSVTQSGFTSLKLLWVPPIHPSSQNPDNPIFPCLHGFPECRKLGIIQHAAFADWLLSLIMCLRVFSTPTGSLITHGFLALNTTPLSGWTRVYSSSTKWRTSWSLPSFGDYELSCYNICASCLCDTVLSSSELTPRSILWIVFFKKA